MFKLKHFLFLILFFSHARFFAADANAEKWKPVHVQTEKVHDEIPGDILVNRIEAEIDGPSAVAVITSLDLERQQMLGAQPSVDELIVKHIKAQKVEKSGAVVANEDILKYLRAVTNDKNFNEEKMLEMGKNWSCTIDEMYEELRRMYLSNMWSDQSIRKAIEQEITPDDIERYCQEHPRIQKAQVVLQIAAIPLPLNKAQQLLDSDLEISWGEPITMVADEIAQDKLFLLEVPVESVHLTQDGLKTKAYKVLNRTEERIVPSSERVEEATSHIKEGRFQHALHTSKESLLSDVYVVSK